MLSRFLAVPENLLAAYLDRFFADGPLERNGGACYWLSPTGMKNGKRTFADEMADLTVRPTGSATRTAGVMIRRKLRQNVFTQRLGKLIPPDLTSPQVLPKNFLRPCLLLLLREHPAHGYDLLERLRPLGFSREDPGRLYRALRALESDGLVRSVWEKSTSGPDRRMYELTRTGIEVLHDSAKALAATDEILGVFLSRYSEFVALDPGKRTRARRS